MNLWKWVLVVTTRGNVVRANQHFKQETLKLTQGGGFAGTKAVVPHCTGNTCTNVRD